MKFEEMFGPAEWVSPGEGCLTPLFRRVFPVEQVEKATLTICGLGFFEAYLNEKRIGKDLFVPLDTNYHERPMTVDGRPFLEKMGTRILCPRYDVTGLLKTGRNVLGVRVGPGYYHYNHTPAYGPARLCFRLEMETGSGGKEIVSDRSVRWHESEVVVSEFTRGEEHDYSRLPGDWLKEDCDGAGWKEVVESPVPPTEYDLQRSPADRVIRTVRPRMIARKGSAKVYDIGENISGRPLVRSSAPKGETVSLRFAEERTPEGFLDESSVKALQGMYLVLKTDGKPRTMTSRFTWFASRYIEVTGDAELTGFEEIHADVRASSAFRCADATLNWLYEAYLRTQLSNMHGGIPSDCPHIERRGYTGDGELVGETAMLLLDAESFYRKWIGDISDCQDRVSGHVQYTAPYVPSGGGPGGWGCAIVEVPYAFYRVYGDDSLLRGMYPQMLRYFDYMEAHSRDGLVVSDEPGCWCLGDWCTPEPVEIPEPYVNTYFYIKSMRRVLPFCRAEDRALLEKRIASCGRAITEHYWDAATGSFCGGVQGADAFAVDLGLGDGRAFDNLVERYTASGAYDTGIFGTDILTRVLFERGCGELAFRLLTGKGPYSYANWMRQGATTLWEYWTGKRSHSHPMFGAVTRYLFQYILGIRQTPESAGFRSILVAPAHIRQLPSAEGSLATKSGRVGVSWRHDGRAFSICVTLEKPCKAVLRWNGAEYRLAQGENSFTLPF